VAQAHQDETTPLTESKRMKHFLKALVQDLTDQAWTLLGLGTAWVLLEGSARALVGNMILITLAIWVITFPIFRYEKPEKLKKKTTTKK
jgi:hypothetical protein